MIDPDPVLHAVLLAIIENPSDEVSRLALVDRLTELDQGTAEARYLLALRGGFWWSRWFEGAYRLCYCHDEEAMSNRTAVNVAPLSRKYAPRSPWSDTCNVWARPRCPFWEICPYDWLTGKGLKKGTPLVELL